MKVIEDEVNKIDYNSDIILTNTTTGKKLIIPKETPKPITFFDIPYDVRDIIYNKVRDLIKKDKYELLKNGYLQYACVDVIFELTRAKKKIEVVNFIDSDDEDEYEDEDEDEDEVEEKENDLKNYENKLDDLLKNIDENDGKIEERITSRIINKRWSSNNDLTIIIQFNFLYDKRKKKIDHIITKEILENEYNLIKHNYSYFEIYDDNRHKTHKKFYHKENDDFFNYLQLYKDEFGEDENIIKLEEDFNNKMKIINNEFAETYGEYLARNRDEKYLKNDYNKIFKKLLFEKMVW